MNFGGLMNASISNDCLLEIAKPLNFVTSLTLDRSRFSIDMVDVICSMTKPHPGAMQAFGWGCPSLENKGFSKGSDALMVEILLMLSL